MSDTRGFHLFDYLDFLVKRKELVLAVFFSSFVVAYLLIFFLVEEQYEATAMLIPRSDDMSSAVTGLLRATKGLPFGLGSKSSARSDIDLYNTVIFSRSMMEDVIGKFGLLQAYRLDTTAADHMELAVKRLKREVLTKETEESAFQIVVRAGTRQRSADMVNYIIRRMNERIIDLNTQRSRDNREFLGHRVEDISATLRAAEDSLRTYQERTGLLDAKTQLQGIITANTTLETELEAKKLQESIMERMYDKESPQVKELRMQIEEYEKRLGALRSQSEPGSPLLALRKLPLTAVEFLRRYREVEINNLLLEYVLPLYEQAKIEEKKDYPVLQIIDQAVPPARKSYPPRTVFALIGSFSVTVLVFLVLLVRGGAVNPLDPRWRTILQESKHWTWNLRKNEW
jgi:uncharacterized protein involved in exopolysaccharide biosynthesis